MLRPIHGRPLVQYAWDAARRSGADEIVVATDAPEVHTACRGFGADVAMTDAAHQSGTDRVNQVATMREWPPDAIVVNVQGDEPLMPPAMIRQAAELLAGSDDDIATLCHPLHALDDWLNPNFVKVVMAETGRALYFSRAPIPWQRDGATRQQPVLPEGSAYRHIGLYAYRVAALARFSTLPVAELERIEALEQLRALAHGLRIRVGVTFDPPPRGVDTEDDLAVVTRLIAPPK